jgi:hypothetical protein
MNVFKLIEDNGLKLDGDIEHFAELVAQQEREACAAVADIALLGCERSIRDRVVRAIRARGEK